MTDLCLFGGVWGGQGKKSWCNTHPSASSTGRGEEAGGRTIRLVFYFVYCLSSLLPPPPSLWFFSFLFSILFVNCLFRTIPPASSADDESPVRLWFVSTNGVLVPSVTCLQITYRKFEFIHSYSAVGICWWYCSKSASPKTKCKVRHSIEMDLGGANNQGSYHLSDVQIWNRRCWLLGFWQESMDRNLWSVWQWMLKLQSYGLWRRVVW